MSVVSCKAAITFDITRKIVANTPRIIEEIAPLSDGATTNPMYIYIAEEATEANIFEINTTTKLFTKPIVNTFIIILFPHITRI